MIRWASPPSLSTLCVVCSAKSSQASALINKPTLLDRSVTPSVDWREATANRRYWLSEVMVTTPIHKRILGAAKRDVCRCRSAVPKIKRRVRIPQLKCARGAKAECPSCSDDFPPENQALRKIPLALVEFIDGNGGGARL